MKKIFISSIFLPLIFYACGEGCDETIAPQLNTVVFANILILDQDGNEVEMYPAEIVFQKRWCDGSWAILVSSSGTTLGGNFTAHSPTYELNNEEDFIQVRYKIGNGDNVQEFSENVTYSDAESWGTLVEKHHTFDLQI